MESIFDTRVSHDLESKYLGYKFLLKSCPFEPEKITEPLECTDVSFNNGTLFIGFKNGFAPKEDCFFLTK